MRKPRHAEPNHVMRLTPLAGCGWAQCICFRIWVHLSFVPSLEHVGILPGPLHGPAWSCLLAQGLDKDGIANFQDPWHANVLSLGDPGVAVWEGLMALTPHAESMRELALPLDA